MPLTVTATLTIPDRLLEVRTARAGGPGGQHVNKVNVRVEICLRLGPELGLPPDALERLMRTQANRISREGVLRIVAQAHREQSRNIADGLERLKAMILAALVCPIQRRPTRPSRASRRRRLDAKRRRGRTKRQRGATQRVEDGVRGGAPRF